MTEVNTNHHATSAGRFEVLLSDLSAGLVVSFLTIAAGSAFGLLTGLGAQAGIMSMIVASMVAWVFGGQRVKASGSTGPTAGAMLTALGALAAYGAGPEAAFAATSIAAIILLVLSVFPLARIMEFVPNAATAVFVNGIGLVILVKQFEALSNHVRGGTREDLVQIALALGALGLLLVWPKLWKPFASGKLGRLITGTLVAMIAGGMLVWLFDLNVTTLAIEPVKFANLLQLTVDGFTAVPPLVMFFVAAKMSIVIAFVTLATVRALAPDADYGVEVRNQGIGNLAVAAVGGVPATLGLVRIRILQGAGGQTVMAGIGSGLIILAMITLIPGLLNYIPTSVFIGVLIQAAWSNIDWRFLTEFRAAPAKNILTFLIVTLGSIAMVFFDYILVLLAATVIWHLFQRPQATRGACPDIESCPFRHRLEEANGSQH